MCFRALVFSYLIVSAHSDGPMFVGLKVCWFVGLLVCSVVGSLVRRFVCLFVRFRLLVCSFVSLFLVCSFVRLLVCLFVC